MFSYLEALQQKPERERRRVHLAVTISLTLVIIAIWVTTLLDTGGRDVVVDHRKTSPFGQMLDVVSNAFIAVGDRIIELGDRVVEIRDDLL